MRWLLLCALVAACTGDEGLRPDAALPDSAVPAADAHAGDATAADSAVDASACHPTCSIGASGCGWCTVQAGGHTYMLDCGRAGAPTCHCTSDGVDQSTVTVTQCFSLDALAAAYPSCGLPCN